MINNFKWTSPEITINTTSTSGTYTNTPTNNYISFSNTETLYNDTENAILFKGMDMPANPAYSSLILEIYESGTLKESCQI